MSDNHDISENAISSEYAKALEERILQLENQLNNMNNTIDRQARVIEDLRRHGPVLPDTNLLNRKFLTRAFTVWGHYFVANLIIATPFVCFVWFFNN